MHIAIIGGSDAGISAALRARELDPGSDVTVVVADAYPNFSICGIPYFFSRDVQPWQSLAHRTREDLEQLGLRLLLDTTATAIDVAGRRVELMGPGGIAESMAYDELVVGTGAIPSPAGIAGLDQLGPPDGVHMIHSMGDMFALERTLEERRPESAIIVGAGYVGLEMAEAFTARGMRVTQIQRGPEVLSTMDAELGSHVRAALEDRGVEVVTEATVERIEHRGEQPVVIGSICGVPFEREAPLVLVVVGVRPNTGLLDAAGAARGPGGATLVDAHMRTGLPHVFAAGDGVTTRHRLLGDAYLPLGTTSHKQGRVAGANAVGADVEFAGSVGTQVVKIFDLVAARTGLREHEAIAAGFRPFTTTTVADDHKRYYPGASPITIRVTGDADTGRLLGAQLVGRLGTETAKRVDTFATALHSELQVAQIVDLDLSYTPPLGSPWDAVQIAAQTWTRAVEQGEAPR